MNDKQKKLFEDIEYYNGLVEDNSLFRIIACSIDDDELVFGNDKKPEIILELISVNEYADNLSSEIAGIILKYGHDVIEHTAFWKMISELKNYSIVNIKTHTNFINKRTYYDIHGKSNVAITGSIFTDKHLNRSKKSPSDIADDDSNVLLRKHYYIY